MEAADSRINQDPAPTPQAEIDRGLAEPGL